MKRASHKKTIFFVIIVKSIIEVILLHVHCTCIVTKRRIYVRAICLWFDHHELHVIVFVPFNVVATVCFGHWSLFKSL